MPVPGPIMIVGADGSVGGRKWLRPLDEHRAPRRRAGLSARYVEQTPLRVPVAGPEAHDRVVRRTWWGWTSGLDEIEYCRGWSRLNTSIHACASAPHPDDRARSMAWRPHVHRATASASPRAGEQLEVAVAGVARRGSG